MVYFIGLMAFIDERISRVFPCEEGHIYEGLTFVLGHRSRFNLRWRFVEQPINRSGLASCKQLQLLIFLHTKEERECVRT